MVARAMLFALLLALPTHSKVELATMGGLFILFALLSSFLAPRLNPNFPGKALRWYVVVCVAFFVAMMSAIIFIAKEPSTAEAAKPNEEAGGKPGLTVPTSPQPTGDPVAGKAVFASAGCGGCHMFTPAGATGTVGPDLDKLADEASKANMGSVEDFTRESIVDPDKYIAPGYSKGIMPGTFGSTLTPTQLDDLVAFLTQ